MVVGVIVAASLEAWTSLIDAVDWPLVVVFAILVAVSDRGRRLLRPILRRIKGLTGPGGVSITLSADAAQATKSDVEGGLRSYADELRHEFNRLSYAANVRGLMRDCVADVAASVDRKAGFRATVYVPDALYTETLYQLEKYWPRGGGAGRRFSMRFGIVGLTWRSGNSTYEPTVNPDKDALIRNWSMTPDEAADAGGERQSFLCILLRHEGSTVGLLYMDAVPQQAFDDQKELLESSDGVARLSVAVAQVHERIAQKGPGLSLFGASS